MAERAAGRAGGGIGRRWRRNGWLPRHWRLGVSVSRVARRHDINANLLFTWRRQVRRGTRSGPPPIALGDESFPLIPIEVTSTGEARSRQHGPIREDPTGIIEIVLPSGERLRVDAWVDEPALRRVLAAIRSWS